MDGDRLLRLVLTGDVMTGRGIDQVFARPSSPELREGYVQSAFGYVRLAEARNGPVPRPVAPDYIWGDALAEFDPKLADLRIVNLETSITTSNAFEDKGINYRMHPANVPCLSAASIDCCGLANNHVLDFGRPGLLETLDSIDAARIGHAGAGADRSMAQTAAVLDVPGKARVLVFGFGLGSSGIPPHWRATSTRPGVNLLPDLSDKTVDDVSATIARQRRKEDFVIASIHWGGNWGYEISDEEIAFARAIIDRAGVDLVYGHSSHHPKGGEVYNGKLILYGCGDFLNDYEGISGRDEFRPDLVLLYRVTVTPQDKLLASVDMLPFEINKFRLCHAAAQDAAWLAEVLDREYRRFGAGIGLREDNSLYLDLSD